MAIYRILFAGSFRFLYDTQVNSKVNPRGKTGFIAVRIATAISNLSMPWANRIIKSTGKEGKGIG